MEQKTYIKEDKCYYIYNNGNIDDIILSIEKLINSLNVKRELGNSTGWLNGKLIRKNVKGELFDIYNEYKYLILEYDIPVNGIYKNSDNNYSNIYKEYYNYRIFEEFERLLNINI